MKFPLYQVDAFSSKLFGGNPAAVVLLETWLPDDTLLKIAAENNLSETAFIIPQGDDFGLRWFTPTIEIDLCGHATLAGAYVLFETGIVKEDVVRFSTQKSGLLEVTRDGSYLSLNFPARPAEPVVCTDEMIQALGVEPAEVHAAARDLLVVYDREEIVHGLRPDFKRVAELDFFAVIATAPGLDVDFVSRFFAPKAGIDEDPVTGSAHCTLVPYWSTRLKKNKLHAFQVSKRRGEIFCEDQGDRVILSGHAVQYLHGEITVD